MIETLRVNQVYENDYVRVYDNEVAFPDGSRGTYYYSRWKAPYGVAVLPVAADNVLLVKNYRYAEQHYSLEIPQGFGRERSTPIEDAGRELTEETGLVAISLRPLLHVGQNFRTHIFQADVADLSLATSFGAEQSEDIAGFTTLRLGEISVDCIVREGIFDPVTIAALLALRTIRQP